MYLDPRPKEDAGSLYDRKSEQEKLRESIKERFPLTLITGFRRVGKTSLLKTVLKTHSDCHIVINLGNLNGQSYMSKKDVANLFQSAVQSFLDGNQTAREGIIQMFGSVRGVASFKERVEFDSLHGGLNLSELFKRLDRWASENDTTIIVAVDEAQEFRKSRHICMTSIFASVYDNCKNTVLVLTGSEIGMLHDFLNFKDPESPLFGRMAKEIRIDPLSCEQGVEFLRMGLEQRKIKGIDQDVLAVAVDDLGGILGWLNQFGLICVENKRVDKRFITDVRNTGSRLARSEFEGFLGDRTAADKYRLIMMNLSIRPLCWTDLKKALEMDSRKIYGANFTALLRTLARAGFVRESDKSYSIIDPLLRFSFEI